jgi:hypothetical protein
VTLGAGSLSIIAAVYFARVPAGVGNEQ